MINKIAKVCLYVYMMELSLCVILNDLSWWICLMLMFMKCLSMIVKWCVWFINFRMLICLIIAKNNFQKFGMNLGWWNFRTNISIYVIESIKIVWKAKEALKIQVCISCNELVITSCRELKIKLCKFYWEANSIIFPMVYSLHVTSCSINTVFIPNLTFLHFIKFWMLICFMIV